MSLPSGPELSGPHVASQLTGQAAWTSMTEPEA
jgi:hypothetical protein